MIFCAALALALVNSAAEPAYHALLTHAWRGIDLHFIINDGLMAIFFLFVGLELKREMMEGFLAQRSQKLLPLFAAAGGVIVPAIIYWAMNRHVAAHAAGWAIPTATDIAFALCILGLCGERVPSAAKVFLLALAIYDDLAAIVVIAVFYSGALQLLPLLLAGATSGAMLLLNHRRVGWVPAYLFAGTLLWWFVHAAGIHTTVAGMITGLMIPMRLHGKNSPSPVNTVLHRLHPYVAFGILPLFAFANAGISFAGLSWASLSGPLPLGIALGLIVGKPVGIFAASWLSIKLNLADRPADMNWGMLLATGTIAGIGFTMSLFISLLAFDTAALRETATLGILVGSVAASLLGMVAMRQMTRRL